MTNKESILLLLEQRSRNIDGKVEVGITANYISSELGIKRNIVSQYLNELNREGKAVKINTRPVYFIHKKVYEEDKERYLLANQFVDKDVAKKSNVFENLIGYDGSLKSVVEQCKSAIHYPTNGLPILFVGDSGVGKSFIAQQVYEYAKATEVIEESARFIIFNCAEYADNPELLSAILFGSCKGAYTGADSDRKGLIEEADGGYLFLDEIHRLSSEGQEKLFVFLDKGVFRRIGETGKWRKAKVRLIFATTEMPEKFFLKTFLRRIPLITHIPNFNERTLAEKFQLITSIYQKEAIAINKDIVLEESVIKVILNSSWSGNVGKLVNIIKITCANAFSLSNFSKDDKLNINVSHIPKDIIYNFNSDLERGKKTIIISREYKENNVSKLLYSEINKINTEAINIINKFKNNDISENTFFEEFNNITNQLIESSIKNKLSFYSEGIMEFIVKIVAKNLNVFKEEYGITVKQNTQSDIINIINSLSIINDDNQKELEELFQFIKGKYGKIYKLIEALVSNIEEIMNIKLNRIITLYITINLTSINKELVSSLINAIIIAHGNNAASSIASVANNMLGAYIYDSLDMPIDVSTEEITKRLREYIKGIDTKNGLILLVDMGSLQEIYLGIKDDFKGDIAIINNLSTLLALDVGNMIMNKKLIKYIVEESIKRNYSKCNYIPASSKKKDAIITTCSTGVGTAERIKDLLEKYLKEKDITILAYDYDKLKEDGENEYIFNEYKVRMIIGLSDPNIKNIPYISLENLIMGENKTEILNSLSGIIDNSKLDELNNTLLKEFTLTNVINHLIILNPEKILTQVQDAISRLEYNLNIKFPNQLKIGIYIHVSCMIERLVIKQSGIDYKNIEEFEKCNRQFIKIAKNAFSVIENFYRVEIPVSEIAYIYDTISRKIEI